MLLYLGIILVVSAILIAILVSSKADSVEANVISSEPNIIGDKFRILTAEELISELELSPVIENIKGCLGLSDENWARDALPFIKNYITFVQRLPASESHHHAGDGGLVKHTLDVAILALKLSTSRSWPPGAPTEEIARLTSVWRFGILVGAILHDVGKILTTYEISLYKTSNEKKGTLWFPDAGNMLGSQAKYYRVAFPDIKVDYQEHTKVAWAFFQSLVPSHVTQWIASDPNLIVVLRSYLTGAKEKVPFSELITTADMNSVARDLKTGARQRFASANRLPLIEIIMDSLHEMLSERSTYFSIGKNSGGDLFRQGDKVYIVCRTVPEKVREYLVAHHPTLAASFPTDNERIFDILLEYGAVEASPYDEHKAVTQVDVSIKKNDGNISIFALTTLCFKIKTLYLDEANYPSEFLGKLVVKNEAPKVVEPKNDSVEANGSEAKNIVPKEPLYVPSSVKKPQKDTKSHQNGATGTLSNNDLALALKELNQGSSNKELIVESKETTRSNESNKSSNSKKSNKSKSGSLDIDSLLMQAEVFSEEIEEIGDETIHVTHPEEINNEPSKPDQTEFLPPDESAQAGFKEVMGSIASAAPSPVHVYSEETIENLASMPVYEKYETETITDQKTISPEEQVRQNLHDAGNKFISWLSNGLAQNTIKYNDSNAPIHFVKEGMILVTPKIFKDFAGGVFDKDDRRSPGVLAQRGFETLKLHERCSKKTAIWTVGHQNKKLFTAYLIPEAHIHYLIQPSSRPQNNTDLALMEIL